MNAYDYTRQVWVDRVEGARVRLAQVQKELELLTGPRGAEYWASTTRKLTLPETLAQCRELIRDCQGEIAQAVTATIKPFGYVNTERARYSITGRAEYTGEQHRNEHALAKVGANVACWSGKVLPQIGQRVRVNFNSFGAGVVVAYFVETGGSAPFLGVEVFLDKRPEWHVKQHGAAHPHPLVFGAEIEAVAGVTYLMRAVEVVS